MQSEHIQVAARVRPPLQKGKRCVTADTGTGRVIVTSTDDKNSFFEFTAVFDENTSQELVYTETAKHVVDGFVTGINGTVFAYGQTGSGKTYTMIGPEMDKPSRGVVPRAIKAVFNHLDDQLSRLGEKFDYITRVSFLELYNERLYDLLMNGESIDYREMENRQVDVQDSEQCLQVISKGWSGRKTAPTAMNIESSRSHAIITLFLRTQLEEDGVVQQRESRLHLVDLAGSERQSETQATGDRLREACNINKSLSTLCQVIRSLSATHKPSYINFRDSLLTRMLKDALGGNSRTSVIVNLHSMAAYYNDSMSTLRFAQNVRKIKNNAKVNENVSGVSAEMLQAKIVELNLKLRAAEEACKQAEARAKAGRSSVESTADNNELLKAEREKFNAMKTQFSTMLHDMKLQLGQSELKNSMLQASNKFLVDARRDIVNTDEMTDMFRQKFDETIEEWKQLVNEESPANASDIELLRYHEEVTRLQRELAKKTEQYEKKNLEFEELNTQLMQMKPLCESDEFNPPLSPVPGQQTLQRPEASGDLAYYRGKYKELQVENVKLNQIIHENKRIIDDWQAAGTDELERCNLKLLEAQGEIEKHLASIKSKDNEIEVLDGEVKRLRERITRADERMTELDGEKFALEKHYESVEHELKEFKEQYEQVLNKGASLRDNIENMSPGGDAASDYERQLLDLQVAFDERENTIKSLREEIKVRDASLATYKKLRTRSTDYKCHRCVSKDEKFADLAEKYDSAVSALTQLETEMQNVCEDYENRLKAGQINTEVLEKKLKDVQTDFDRCSNELRVVIGVVLESTVSNTETRFSVFGPGCLSGSQSGFQFVCERLRQQRQALANAELDVKITEKQKEDALEKLNEVTAELNKVKDRSERLKVLVDEKQSSIEKLNNLMDETAGLRDNKARIKIFDKLKNEKYQVEMELFQLKQKCKCGAAR
uniref:Kinesin-like protein n=1 Tax=Panagrellus redivivus TaxID=6233 RepID=A0A7E4UVH3_PANRE